MKSNSHILTNIKDLHFEVCSVCDLACIYCSAFNPNAKKKAFMAEETAYGFIDLVFSRSCASNIGLLFYGGEALLQNSGWFYNVINYALKKAENYDKKLHFYMQSCATVMDDEKLELINKYNINIGTSLDGPPEINNKTRGKTNLVSNNIEKIKNIGCFGGVICTANQYNYNKIPEILEYFEDHELFWIAINIVSSIGRGKNLEPLNEEKIFTVYKDIYEYFVKSEGKKVIEGNMAERLDKYIFPPTLSDNEHKLSCNRPICGGGITLVLCDINGDLYPCGCSNMTSRFFLGNVNSLNDDFYLHQIYEFHRKDKKYYEECHRCDASKICNFGCTGFNIFDNSTFESECRATKMLFSYLEKEDPQIIQSIVKNLRAGKKEHDWRTIHGEGGKST